MKNAHSSFKLWSISLAVSAMLAACGGVEQSTSGESEDEIKRGGFDRSTVSTFLLESNRYSDIVYLTSPATIVNPLGTWTADGNKLTLFRSEKACDGAIELVQCQPEPNAYSHYISTQCDEGPNPVNIGQAGYVCPELGAGSCPAGTSLIYSGTNSGRTFRPPFANGQDFSTNLIIKNRSVLANNGEIAFSNIVALGCSP